MDERLRTALKTALKALLEAVDGDHERRGNDEVKPEPKYMTLAGFAKRIGYSRSTVRSWIVAGMPAVRGGRGHRVIVAAAERWIADGGPVAAVRRLARTEARKTG